MSSWLLRVGLASDQDLLAAARAVEADVLGTTFGNTPEQLDDEYGPFDASSVLVVASRDGVPVSGMRLLRDSPAGHKSLLDASGEPWNLDCESALREAGVEPIGLLDVATYVISSAHRKSLATPLLLHGLIQTWRGLGVTHLVAIIDEAVRVYLDRMGIRLHALGGASPAPYLGSEASRPVIGDFAQMFVELEAASKELHQFVAGDVRQRSDVEVSIELSGATRTA